MTGERRRRTHGPRRDRACRRSSAACVVRGVVIAALLAVRRRSRCPTLVGADWITTFTSVAIYAIVALGFGILYGRVGMISLGQVALLSIGCWVGTRLAYATSLPFPVLLLVVGAITVRDRHARRPAGAAALRPLSRADHADVRRRHDDRAVGDRLPERRRRLHGPVRRPGALTTSTPPVRRPVDGRSATSRSTATSSSSRAHVPARARARLRQAGPCVGVDPRERARGARRRREHHALQAVGVRARVVHDRRRGLPARRAGRRAARDHVPDAGLADARRDGADRRHLQPLGRGRRRHLQPARCRSSSRRSGASTRTSC